MIPLDDIVGQETAVDRLRSYLAGGRVPHAMLFAGPRGVGRRTTAEALAGVLLCESPSVGPTGPRACGSCESCRLLAAGNHPDFHLVYKELARFHEDARVRNRVMQELSIEVVRDFLIAPAGRSASKKHGRVFVVREAELMSNPAQNALLKTLEEPPAGVRIILLSEKPDLLLPTTRSRCALVRFGPLPRGFVSTRLAEAGLDDREASFWASFADGSIGRALELSEAGLYEIKREIVERLVQLVRTGDARLGEDLAKTVDKLAEQSIRKTKKDEDANLSKNLASRQASGVILELMASLYRDAMHLGEGSNHPGIHADQPDAPAALAERFAPAELAEILEQLSRYERLLWRNLNNKIVWDNVAVTCASAQPLGV